jgi:predicted RNase H-like HicB family nuclease
VTDHLLGYVLLTQIVEPAEEGGFVSRCPELDVYSQGETIDEAFASIHEAILVQLQTLTEIGQLDSFFAERGIPLQPEASDKVTIEVSPNDFVAAFVAPIPA